MNLYHMSFEERDEIMVHDGGLFGGVFALSDRNKHDGDYCYMCEIAEDKILDEKEIFNLTYSDEYEKLAQIIEQVTDVAQSDERFGRVFNAITLEDYNEYNGEFWSEILGETEPASIGFALQRMRGEMAKELGFSAVTMNDEHGRSFLVLPGNTFKKI